MALAPHLPENLARRVAERAFTIVKEIIEDIGRDAQDSSTPFDFLKIQALLIKEHILSKNSSSIHCNF
jgi:hypothetical protein